MNNYLLVVFGILVILVGMKRVEGMKMEEKKKRNTALRKFM
jgi:hypothetical protein